MTKTLLPAYSWAGDSQAWSTILAMPPGIAVINPASGPGTKADSTVAERVNELVALGWETVGYVSTQYFNRPLINVTAEVTRWRSYYPKVKGIFFDEIPTPATGVLEAALAYEGIGSRLGGTTVLNVGAPVDARWYSVLKHSIIVECENSRAVYGTLTFRSPHERSAHLVYASPGSHRVSAPWGYSTPDEIEPNCWDNPNPDWRG